MGEAGEGRWRNLLGGAERNVQPFPFLERRELPRLPVPSLEETGRRYVEYVAPLVGDEQARHAQRLVGELVGGEGRALQQELLRLDQESPTSWLEGWWDTGYLEYRVPTFINVNPFFILRETEPLQATDQLEKAARVASAAIRFYKKVIANSLSQDKEKNTPLCMTQYGRLFATFRAPLAGRDAVYTYRNSRHLVVAYKRQFFTFDVLQQDGSVLSDEGIRTHLAEAVRLATTLPEVPAVGLFTTEHRDAWARIRGQLSSVPENMHSLQQLDSALFVLVLEEAAPVDFEAAAPIFLHGDVKTRWFDKLQFIVCANGLSGVNMEHAPYDGHTILRLLNDVWRELKDRPSSPGVRGSSTVTRLEWVAPAQFALTYELSAASNHAAELIDRTETRLLIFEQFGSKHITQELKLSPDAFVQMAFQLAYYKLHQHPASTYESAQTKRFYHGRTECMRSVTVESVAFTKKWVAETGDEEKEAALRAAVEAHVRRLKEAKNGRGVDRHWLALQSLARHKQQRSPGYIMPQLFVDPSYATLSASVLSTSNCGSPAIAVFGFGPVVANGLGLGYLITPTALHVCVSSFIGEAGVYRNLLHESLCEMSALILRNRTRSTASNAGNSHARL